MYLKLAVIVRFCNWGTWILMICFRKGKNNTQCPLLCSFLFYADGPLMLTGCRNLFLTFASHVHRRTWMCKRFKPKSELHFSASEASFSLPSVSSSPQQRIINSSSFLHPPFSSAFRPPHCSHFTGPMELKETLQVLEQLAPLSLAESWDNVGLLVEPSKPRPVKTILLTNDLTDAVMAEAEALSCDLIISYHPPLFRPVKRLNQKDWKQRLAIRAVEAGIAVFSPHTSWDSVKGGVNDWLVAGLGKELFWQEIALGLLWLHVNL